MAWRASEFRHKVVTVHRPVRPIKTRGPPGDDRPSSSGVRVSTDVGRRSATCANPSVAPGHPLGSLACLPDDATSRVCVVVILPLAADSCYDQMHERERSVYDTGYGRKWRVSFRLGMGATPVQASSSATLEASSVLPEREVFDGNNTISQTWRKIEVTPGKHLEVEVSAASLPRLASPDSAQGAIKRVPLPSGCRGRSSQSCTMAYRVMSG